MEGRLPVKIETATMITPNGHIPSRSAIPSGNRSNPRNETAACSDRSRNINASIKDVNTQMADSVTDCEIIWLLSDPIAL